MGNHIAITENGKHKIGKRLFVTDENGKHRKGKKAFLTQNGKHRLVFSAGNDWAKYSCDVTPAHYVRTEKAGDTKSGTWVSATARVYDYYSFSETSGFSGEGAKTYAFDDCVGYHRVSDTEVMRYDSIEVNGDGTCSWEGTVIASCEYVATAYAKGTSDYGKLFADEGELPEAGTLIDGSVAEGYCVLQIDGANYYYEIVG